MKTTIEVSDELLLRAKQHAKRTGRTLRAVVEEGLRLTLSPARRPAPFRLPDRSVGKRGGDNPLERMSWQDLREEIYGGR